MQFGNSYTRKQMKCWKARDYIEFNVAEFTSSKENTTLPYKWGVFKKIKNRN